MKTYYRVMLGGKSKHAAMAVAGNFIGADYAIEEDLSHYLPEQWKDFNAHYIPIFLSVRPDKSKIAAGLACGALWVIAKGIRTGDIALCPDGNGRYHVGEVVGDYYHAPNQPLPHRRPVKWYPVLIDRTDMSSALRGTTAATGTVCNLSRSGHDAELERLIAGTVAVSPEGADSAIEDPAAFAMEKHLEDFLIENWSQTELGKEFDIYEEDGERVGQQYLTDTGPMDVLAISKDRKRLLVVELKRGRASDAVVGQVLRYMGYVQEELAEEWQTVEGAIIALDDDLRIRRALKMTPSIRFYRYEVSFKLNKA